jgi:hypothetical protein
MGAAGLDAVSGGRSRWGSGLSLRSMGPLTFVILLASCGEKDGAESGWGDEEGAVGRMVLEWSIGEDGSSGGVGFWRIRRLVVQADESLWVLDGEGQGTKLRRFGPDGRLLHSAGGVGGGPGEFRDPVGLAPLPDGRMALRDGAAPHRITIYRPEGELDTIWSLADRDQRGGRSVLVDTGGVLWLDFTASRRPGPPPRPEPTLLRAKGDGAIVDSLSYPPLPEVESESLRVVRTSSSGGVSVRGVVVPYQPAGGRAWSPLGTFALFRTDEYRIELIPPPGLTVEGRDPWASEALWVATRDVPPVPVPQAERSAERQRMREQLAALEGGRGMRVPDVPAHKPILRSVQFSADGWMWVSVSQPTVRKGGQWVEPVVYDVFRPDGSFHGRVAQPEGFRVVWVQGEHVWGTALNDYDVETVRRYRVVWR